MKNKYTKEQVENAVLESKCYSDVFRNLGLKINGGSYHWIKNLIKKHDINITHFLTSKELFKLNHFIKKTNFLGIQKIESNQRIRAKKLRKFMLDNNVDYKCNICNILEWLGKPMTLDIDHIDENCLNNQIENLQFLCPNCHRQKTQLKLNGCVRQNRTGPLPYEDNVRHYTPTQ
jgi:5-methylcytosine-specific restriction endonuclease McrA